MPSWLSGAVVGGGEEVFDRVVFVAFVVVADCLACLPEFVFVCIVGFNICFLITVVYSTLEVVFVGAA